MTRNTLIAVGAAVVALIAVVVAIEGTSAGMTTIGPDVAAWVAELFR
ncbi:hypothetical protein [Phytoactinopolyspora endophytica]|nr:hypothetical protein [Phytoactinopolyspora endophytica]